MRAIPIRFTLAPHVKKSGKKATEEDKQNFKVLSKQKNLSTTFVQKVINLRKTLKLDESIPWQTRSFFLMKNLKIFDLTLMP